MKTEILDLAFQQGWDAFFDGRPITDNPYIYNVKHNETWIAWQNGWEDAEATGNEN